jgi:hypothetical protein
MIKINNLITKFFGEKSCNIILSIFDFDEVFDETKFIDLLQLILHYSPNLKQTIEKQKNGYYWINNNQFNITNHYTIKNEKVTNFDTNTKNILNEPFLHKNKWHFTILNDIEHNKSRIYVKIDHSYCDGYKLADILLTPFSEKSYIKPIFKRTNQTIFNIVYYYIIGTILLIILYINTLYSLYTKPTITNYSNNKMNIISCGKIKIKKIKKITSKYNITINSFLYALMIKTWYKYTENKDIITFSPIYINNNDNNNIFFVISKLNPCKTDVQLLTYINELFNIYKFSPFIYISNIVLHYILQYLPMSYHSQVHTTIFKNIILTFSNMIGPSNNLKKCNLDNIQYTTTTENNEVRFSLISYDNNITTNVSYREGIITDKKRFLKCYKEAYHELIALKN